MANTLGDFFYRAVGFELEYGCLESVWPLARILCHGGGPNAFFWFVFGILLPFISRPLCKLLDGRAGTQFEYERLQPFGPLVRIHAQGRFPYNIAARLPQFLLAFLRCQTALCNGCIHALGDC